MADAQGTFGAPPLGAPYETTQPIAAEVHAQQIARARANEKTLAPLAPSGGRSPEDVLRETFSAPAPLPAVVAPVPPPVASSHQPAASDTDSPARGIPQPITDPGKRITGGFGDVGEAQYFALDGSELRELVRHLLDEVNQRIENDLRFHLAVTYPRVTARVTIAVEGWAKDAGFEIVKQVVHEKTPVAVAEAAGATPVAFEVVALRQEFDADGNAENPPDRIRDELGLEKPRKQTVQAGGQRILVDRPATTDGSF